MTHKGVNPSDWSPSALLAFENLKSAFAKAPILSHQHPALLFTLEVDASESGVGSLLSHRLAPGKTVLPCGFFLRNFPKLKVFDIGDRELLAIILVLREWRYLLEGTSTLILILTDHKNLTYLSQAKRLSPCSGQVLSGRPFVILWNAPTRPCWEKFGVTINMAEVDIVFNHNFSFVGTEVVIFYKTHLGLYPYYDGDTEPVNGGLPQNASLMDHLIKAQEDVEAAILFSDFNGVAVVDWEDWRPLWTRNWNNKSVYIKHSLELVRQRHPYWSLRKVKRVAKWQFEEAAQNFILSTLELSRKLRPKGLWGFYGFPECYNYYYRTSTGNYTGECPKHEILRNDRLTWMWEASQALYPNIYLEKELRMSEHVGRFVKHRLEEAFRVSRVAPGIYLPILPYARIVYTHSMDFLVKEDLIQTIGQSAALGAAGVILWGNADFSRSKESCLAVKSYVEGTVGKYIKNVTAASEMCSQALCKGNGRCVRKVSSSEVYLHLDPKIFSIRRKHIGTGFTVSEDTPVKKSKHMWTHFQCRCYRDWKGTDCSRKMDL
ncbi:hyaluronidase-1-like [Rhinophrynus dorsalis]